MHERKLSLIEHLSELRSRIFKSLLCVIICSVIVYNQIPLILNILARPVGKLIFLAPEEAFITGIKISLWGGLFLSSPFVIYELWMFIGEALTLKERKYILFFGIFSLFLFIIGSTFGFFLIIPFGIKFLLNFSSDYLIPMLSVSKYVSFVSSLTFAFGIVFELPLVLLFLTKMGIITPQFLTQRRREAIVVIFILAAILTPTVDIITQLLMAGPLLILYELGIIFSKIAYRKQD